MRRRAPDSSSTVAWEGKQLEDLEPALVPEAAAGLAPGLVLVELDPDDDERHEFTDIPLPFSSVPKQQVLEHIVVRTELPEVIVSEQQLDTPQGTTVLEHLPPLSSLHSACAVWAPQALEQVSNSSLATHKESARLTTWLKRSKCTAPRLDISEALPWPNAMLAYPVETRSSKVTAARAVLMTLILGGFVKLTR
jgi:hypothetical protein